jgi:hypothetical protein
MAIPGMDTRRGRGGTSAQPASSPHTAAAGAPLAPTLALTITLAVAGFAVVLAAAVLVVDPGPQAPLDTEHAQRLESALYVVAFALILPLALIVVPRLADAIAAGPNARGLPVLAASLTAALGAAIFLARALFGGGVEAVLAVVGAWWIGAAALLVRASRPASWDTLLKLAGLARLASVVAGVLVFLALLKFGAPTPPNVLVLRLGLLVAGAMLLVFARWGAPRLPRRWGAAVEIAVVGLVLLAVTDLVIFGPADAAVIHFHHNLWLGATNQVLAGDPVLVDTASQYGIASIYLLAAWFQVAPIGYGTLGFLDGALFAVYIAAGYCVLRLAGASRLLAGLAVALAVVTVAYDHPWSLGGFGLPLIVILAAVIEARSPRRAHGAWAAQLAVVGLSSIWALETFAYTLFTFAAIVCFRAWLRLEPGRLAWMARQAALTVAACVAAQLIFIAATLAFSGELPDYGWYLAFVHYFLFGGQSKVTYDFTQWSPGLPLAAAYAASAAAFILLVRRRRDIVERERTALTALCGTTAYGIVLFSYFVDRSLGYQLTYLALPALLAGALWLSLLLRRGVVESAFVRVAGLGVALSLAAVLVSVGWSFIGDRFGQSALAHVIPGGESLGGAMHRLWHPPPFDPRVPEGERLLDRYMTGERRVLILVAANRGTEILLRSGRANELPFSYPWEDSWLGTRLLPRLRDAVDRLRPDDLLLMDTSGLKQLHGPVAAPLLNSIDNPLEISPDDLAPLQISALRLIARRFDLRVLQREQGFFVVSLVPRR